MIIRAIGGFLVVALTLLSLKAGALYFGAFWLLVTAFAHQEAYSMTKFKVLGRVYIFCMCIHLASLLILLQKFESMKKIYDLDVLILSPVLFLILAIFNYTEQNKDEFFEDFGRGFLMFSYVVFFFSPMIVLLLNVKSSLSLILLLFCIMWLQDTFAYFGGRAFGKHKFSQYLSPKKTWEGSIIGILVMMGVLYTVHQNFGFIFKDYFLLCLFIIGIAGQIGDLLESCFKRCLSVKDSGWIIPGHGGVLDRFDSVTAGALCALYLLLIF
ncbi:MAG: phosphatidate cytidylyltransferase [Candidatus Cloacimonetes bacterium]|nr:phosphatidate cytidylyltransferase [Candidatus Cloacimonadota bacterium]